MPWSWPPRWVRVGSALALYFQSSNLMSFSRRRGGFEPRFLLKARNWTPTWYSSERPRPGKHQHTWPFRVMGDIPSGKVILMVIELFGCSGSWLRKLIPPRLILTTKQGRPVLYWSVAPLTGCLKLVRFSASSLFIVSHLGYGTQYTIVL
jgi:hypothetical protein